MNRYRFAFGAAVGVGTLSFLVFAALNKPHVVCEQRASLWFAASTAEHSEHDLWFEFNPITKFVSSIYRDLDRDGLVDERLLICGPIRARFYSTSGEDGLNRMQDLNEPESPPESIGVGSPEYGPFTREELDKKAHRLPVDESLVRVEKK